MLGAIAGDIIGSVYEGKKQWLAARTADFQPLFCPKGRFTDDTVLSVAVADALLHGSDLTELLKDYYSRYPGAGFGGDFKRWAASDNADPYGSWGNGSAMRVSPVAWAFDTLAEVLYQAKESARVTHNHPTVPPNPTLQPTGPALDDSGVRVLSASPAAFGKGMDREA